VETLEDHLHRVGHQSGRGSPTPVSSPSRAAMARTLATTQSRPPCWP